MRVRNEGHTLQLQVNQSERWASSAARKPPKPTGSGTNWPKPTPQQGGAPQRQGRARTTPFGKQAQPRSAHSGPAQTRGAPESLHPVGRPLGHLRQAGSPPSETSTSPPAPYLNLPALAAAAVATWDAQGEGKGPRGEGTPSPMPGGKCSSALVRRLPLELSGRLFSFARTSSPDWERGSAPPRRRSAPWVVQSWLGSGVGGWKGDAAWKQHFLTSLDAVPSTLLRSVRWRRYASGKRKRTGPWIAGSGFLFFCWQDWVTGSSSFVCCPHPALPFCCPTPRIRPLGVHASSLTPPWAPPGPGAGLARRR